MTGHDEGVITLSLAEAEADDAERERPRTQLGEPYRTLLGHFRHEVGHYFWDVLVRDRGHLDASRATFGDDREDYDKALKRHYAHGAPADWQDRFVSASASAHAAPAQRRQRPINCNFITQNARDKLARAYPETAKES